MAAEIQLPPPLPKVYSFDIPSIFEARPALLDNPHIVNFSQSETVHLDFNASRKRGEPIDSSHVIDSQRACKLFKSAHEVMPDRYPAEDMVFMKGYSQMVILASGIADFRQGVDPGQPEILQALATLNNKMTEMSNRIDQKMTTMSDGFDRKMNRLDEKMKRLDEKMTRADQKIEGLTTTIDDLKKELSGRIDKLEVTVKDLEKDIKGLSDKVTDLDGRVVGLSRTVKDLERTVAGLTNRVTALEGSVTGLTNRVTDLEGSVTGLTDRVTALEGSVNGLTNNVTALEGSVNGLTNSVTALEGTVNDVDGRLIGLTNTVVHLDDTLAVVAANLENILILKYNKSYSSGTHKLLQKTIIGDGDHRVGPTMGANTLIPPNCPRGARIGQVFPKQLKIDSLKVPDIVQLIVFYNLDFGITAASSLAAKKVKIRDWAENRKTGTS